jgi:protein TonB
MTGSVPIARVCTRSLRGFPGYWLRSLAEFWLDREDLSRVVDAALADLHHEWAEARADRRRWTAHWLALRGNAALARLLLAFALAVSVRALPRLAAIALGAVIIPSALFSMLANAIRVEHSPWIPGSGPVIRSRAGLVVEMVHRAPPPKPRLKLEEHPLGPGPGLSPIARREPAPGGGAAHWTEWVRPQPEMQVPLRPLREVDTVPVVRIPPDYPRVAAQRGIEGFVVVRLWIGTRGEVSRAEIAQARPRGVFERAALKAVRRWRYRPAEVDGQAVGRGPLEVLFDFKLEDAKE